MPQPQSTTVKDLPDALGRGTGPPEAPLVASTSFTTLRNSLTWSYLPRIEARTLPSPSARPIVRRSAADSKEVSGRFLTRSCGLTTTARSISAERVTITWPFFVTRMWRSPVAVIR